MEEYYVLNHRLPKFPIKDYGINTISFKKSLDDNFKKWILEKVVSNLQRRKVCSEIFEFARWLKENKMVLEHCSLQDYLNFATNRSGPQVDFKEFLQFAQNKIPELDWKLREK